MKLIDMLHSLRKKPVLDIDNVPAVVQATQKIDLKRDIFQD